MLRRLFKRGQRPKTENTPIQIASEDSASRFSGIRILCRLFKRGRRPKTESTPIQIASEDSASRFSGICDNKLRWDLIYKMVDNSQLVTPGNDDNEKYEGRIKYIQDNKKLTTVEKKQAKAEVTLLKDYSNLIEIKGPTYRCERCHQQSLTISCCEHCTRSIIKANMNTWTSGNESIDKAIQDCQLKCPLPGFIIEWIPYKDLKDVVYKTKGGSSSIYTATWIRGYVKSFNRETQQFVRRGSFPVILKRIKKSEQPNDKFLNEIKQHLLLRTGYNVPITPCYGVTRDPTTLEYILVVWKMEKDLPTFIKESIRSLTWKDVNYLFWHITGTLDVLHQDNFVHKDLHPGNILSSGGRWHISDFGICGPANQSSSSIYGNLPYIAPEVIRGAQYSTAADIYSVGMLMYYIAVGRHQFVEQNDKLLAFDICNGIRPPITKNLPNEYKQLMQQCWDADTSKRPNARQLRDYFFYECQRAALSSRYGRELVNPNGLVVQKGDDIKQSSIYEFDNLPTPRNATLEEQEEYNTRQYSLKSLSLA